MDDVIKNADSRFGKAVDALKKNFAAIRTGRATPALLDHVMVDYYGSKTSLKQLAGISIPEPRTITITPYDKNSVKDIEKALLTSNLGLPPRIEAGLIRLTLPQPTEERRKDLVKLVKKESEDAKVGVRNIRREIMDEIKKEKTKGAISEDQEKMRESELEKHVKKITEEIDRLCGIKEKEVMEV